jgi:hypothetical protein
MSVKLLLPRSGQSVFDLDQQAVTTNKEILRNRIDRDFGPGAWASITPNEKALLWSTGRTFE